MLILDIARNSGAFQTVPGTESMPRFSRESRHASPFTIAPSLAPAFFPLPI